MSLKPIKPSKQRRSQRKQEQRLQQIRQQAYNAEIQRQMDRMEPLLPQPLLAHQRFGH